MKYILLLGVLFFTINCFAQTVPRPTIDTSDKKPVESSVIIHKDARLDLLVKKQASINEATVRESKRTDNGYRIMIISTNNREEAIAAKTKVYANFPELKAYLLYQSPYFKLKAGNFKDRSTAEDYRKRMNPFFPKGVFIMNDIIEVKPVKSDLEDN
jgi:hypothetical protein